MKKLFVSLFCILFSLSSFATQREVRMNQLKEVQLSNHKAIEEFRSQIGVQLEKMSKMPLNIRNESRTHANLAAVESQVEKLIHSLNLRYAQIDFWDRLIFETERKYTGGNYKEFLEKNLLEIAKAETFSPDGKSKLWRSFAFASWAIRNACEREEDPIQCLSTQLTQRPVSNEEPPPVESRQAKKKEKTEKTPLQKDLEKLFIRLQKSNAEVSTGSLDFTKIKDLKRSHGQGRELFNKD